MGRYITFWISDDGHVDTESGDWDEYADQPAPVVHGKDDLYQPEFLSWILRQVGIESSAWILRSFDPGRIVQVCCYALQKKKLGQVQSGTRQIVLHALRSGYDVPDCRQQVLPAIAKTAPTTRDTEAKVREVRKLDETDRQAAAKMLQQFLFDGAEPSPAKGKRNTDAEGTGRA